MPSIAHDNVDRSRVLAGIKPTGRLHLGNLEGAVRTLVELQRDHEVLCMIADWHAFTTMPTSGDQVRRDTGEVALDLLAVGVDPERAILFRQSDVREHAELYLVLSMLTPVSWLERVPTFKEAVSRGGSIGHGLLGYPVLQAADILLHRATMVPVGSDQLPHLELTREIARRFASHYGEVFVEPRALLSEAPIVPGLDGRKMSKSRDNAIYLADEPAVVADKVRAAFTTPTKVRVTDPGVPEGCTVCQLRRIYDGSGWRESWEQDRAGQRGCGQNKLELIEVLERVLAPIRARRAAFEAEPGKVEAILRQGADRARPVAVETMAAVRRAMCLPR